MCCLFIFRAHLYVDTCFRILHKILDISTAICNLNYPYFVKKSNHLSENVWVEDSLWFKESHIVVLGAGKSRDTIYSKIFICSLGYSQGSA